ncbi:hypothetical protein K458DRAFT_273150, partial [Lentithecium fluviatile CBS 122367]
SVVLSQKAPSLRNYSYSCTQPPPLPPRRHSVAVPPPLKVQTTTQSVRMDSRYYRPSSPRGRLGNPARSSTGTFDPYADSTYYARPASPRTSGERITGAHYPQHTYTPSTSSGSRTSSLKYDSYTGRPRRNTLTESDDRLTRPNVNLAPITSIPIRSHGVHTHHEPVSSPLARSFDNRAETYITHGAPRREHKKIYSVDDDSHSTRLVAEKDVIEHRRRESGDARGYSINSGGRTYNQHKPLVRATEFGDDGYSYTDPASMYRDTEPAWRRPRSGSVEHGSRPTSMIMDRGPRVSNRELGPPPSTRGFDKINNGITKSSSHHRGRSPSLERPRDVAKYDPYADVVPARTSSTRHHAPAIHQEPRDHRRDTYHEDYDRRDRDTENRRYPPVERFEDRDVVTRGFGIASGNSSHIIDPPLERQPVWTAPEAPRARPDEYGNQYYSSDRAEARMPESRLPREREAAPTYEERPRERERERDRRDSSQVPATSAVPIAASAAAGAAATLGAAGLMKSRDRDRPSDRDRERDLDKDREPRKERDGKDRRDRVPDDRRDDRRDRGPEDRRDRAPEERRERAPEERLPLAAAAYASAQDTDRKPRERRYEGEDRDRRPRKRGSSEGSGDERPRHYVDRDAAREAERRKEPLAKEAPLDPDEEYRRRIQQEAERSGRARDPGDLDGDTERRRRREDRDRSRDRTDDPRARGPPSAAAEPPYSRYDDRSSRVLEADVVQEPDSMDREQPSKAVQIVTPPKEPQPQPKGILRKPTEKFPEDPEPIREGVAPHKSAMKGKDIPPNARWTKIDRKLVNPQALEEAKERFEERLDCVIVLRVLTKQEIQKLADRTKEIREAREEEYDDRDRDHRDQDRRSRRSHRDDDDGRGRRDYDDDDDDDVGRRDRERE